MARAGVAVGAVLLAMVLGSCGASTPPAGSGPIAGLQVSDDDGIHGVVLPKAYRPADVPLVDTSGTTYDLATDPSKPLTLVFFGYTNCPDICQVVMANVASALVRLDAGERAQVDMVFVTTDPRRDTRRRLRSYLDRFDPGFHGLTGGLPRIVRAGKALGVPIEKGKKLVSGGYDVAHGTPVIGLLPDHSAPFVWTEGTAPGALSTDVRKILAGKVPV